MKIHKGVFVKKFVNTTFFSVEYNTEGHGIAPLPHTPAEPGVERLGRGVLRPRQAGLCVSGLLGDLRDGGRADPRVDRALQPARPAQCAGDAVTRSVLCRLENQKHATTCPKLGGAVQWTIMANAPATMGDIE